MFKGFKVAQINCCFGVKERHYNFALVFLNCVLTHPMLDCVVNASLVTFTPCLNNALIVVKLEGLCVRLLQ